MRGPLVWREWRELSITFWWGTAGVVFLTMTVRIVDEVIGVAFLGVLLAITLGNAATLGDRSHRIREFILTRPVSRRQVIGAKLGLLLALVNGGMLVLIAIVMFDLPGKLYGLVAETTVNQRLYFIDAPLYYPAAVALANVLMLITVALRIFSASPATGGVIGIILALITGIATARVIALWPGSFALIALVTAVLFAAASVVLVLGIVRGFERLEITGGFAS